MRKTDKLLKAFTLLAAITARSVGEVERQATDYQRVYAELYMRGYSWQAGSKRWYALHEDPPAFNKAVTRLATRIRVMCDERGDAEIAANYLCEVLRGDGAEIVRVSDEQGNQQGRGGRVYVEIGL